MDRSLKNLFDFCNSGDYNSMVHKQIVYIF